MVNDTQLERYKKLLSFIDENFKEEITVEKIEDICHYSYRNINRIFLALQAETIGKYIKRLRLEKAAQYLKYSEIPISDIAYTIGFEDRVTFSKAFKNKYQLSPSGFRNSNESILETLQQSILNNSDAEHRKLEFEIEYLPDFEHIFLTYRGSYRDVPAIEKDWDKLFDYAMKKKILSDHSIFFTEIIDGNEISDTLNFRLNLSLILEKSLNLKPEGLFRTKFHQRQKYVKFVHQGAQKGITDFYQRIYAFWMQDVNLELVDLPILEFYSNLEKGLSKEKLITKIYIPVA